MRSLVFIYAVLLSYYSIGQNKSYSIIYTEVYPIQYNSYNEAKAIWKKCDRKYSIDPSETLLFLAVSLQNDDVKYYKKSVGKLIRKYHWKYIEHDPSVNQHPINIQIKSKGLDAWTLSKTDKKIKRSFAEKDCSEEISNLFLQDQLDTKLSDDSLKVVVEELGAELGIVERNDWNRMLRLAELCEVQGTMINNFDHGIGTYNKVQLMMLHAFKSKNLFQPTWDLLFPYLENAYLEGKISGTFFQLYDQWSTTHTGEQYYGTLENVPCRDQENLSERIKKYQL